MRGCLCFADIIFEFIVHNPRHYIYIIFNFVIIHTTNIFLFSLQLLGNSKNEFCRPGKIFDFMCSR